MNDTISDPSVASLPNRVFIHQTGVAVYALPSSDADVLVRLHEGNPLTLLGPQDEANPGWLPVQAGSGQKGFIKANTRLTTREQLLAERERTRRGYTLGRGKMVMGGAIFLFGAASLAFFLLFADKHAGPFVIYYGAI